MAHLYAALTVGILTSKSEAYTKFQFNCTNPPNGTNFVFSPQARGTLDILFNSLFTIFACTYTILHLNIPAPRQFSDGHGWQRRIQQQIMEFFTQNYVTVKWMFISVIAPELILAKAGTDYQAAKREHKEMQIFAKEDSVEWTVSHAFLANMGGFVGTINAQASIETPPIIEKEVKGSTIMEGTSTTDLQRATPTVSPSTLEAASPPAPSVRSQDCQVLVGRTLYELRKNKYIKRLPDLTKREIMDRSKGSLFVKVIAMFQAGWNIIQILTRIANKLAVTQLELAVVAFSWCSLTTYMMVLQKPKSVELPIRPIIDIQIPIGATNNQVELGGPSSLGPNWISDQNSLDTSRIRDHFPQFTRDGTLENFEWRYVPNDHFDGRARKGGLDFLALGGVIFGGFHAAGWNLSFTTDVEQQLWQASSIWITGSILIVLLLRQLPWDQPTTFQRFYDLFLVVLYTTARLILLVEYFRSLFFLPPDEYTTTWTSDVPHI